MARLRAGILGQLRGKVAGVVGAQWKDKNYIREYVKPANPDTAAQQTQRSKMADVVEFSKPLVGPVFNAYTDRFQKSMSGFNRFIKTNIGEFDGSPVFANILLTEGKLSKPLLTSCTYDSGTGVTSVVWTSNLGNNGAETDQTFMALYHEPTKLWYFPGGEELRSAHLNTFEPPSGLTATDFECYLWAARYSGTLVELISTSDHIQAVAP